MNERLIVKNFLCLENIDIEVKDFLVIIGPQAAGKSLCAKLLYFFRMVFGEMTIHYLASAFDEPPDLYVSFSNIFKSFFPKAYWNEQDFYIEYQRNQKTLFHINKEEDPNVIIHFDKGIQDVASETRELFKILSNKYSNYPFATNIFIPAGRSFFSLLQKNIFRFLRSNNNLDPFLLDFGSFYEGIKQTEYDIPAEAQMLIHSILKGDYVYKENLLMLADGKKVALELLSSGQQEALPLALILAHTFYLRLAPYDIANICVEEPEAHLFPNAQEKVSRLISFVQYNASRKVRFVITTHSPYILAAFNNLIKAGNIVRQNPGLKDAVYKVIPESMHIDIEHFSAYSLKGGKAVSIIDEDSHLINADAIDGVSESIMETFNTLLDIEFDGDKAGKNV